MGNSSRLRHLDALLDWALQSSQNLLDAFRWSSEPHRGDLGLTEVHVNDKKGNYFPTLSRYHTHKKGQNVELKN